VSQANFHLANGEIEAVVDCFTVDAILKSPVIDISGRAAGLPSSRRTTAFVARRI
jgi:hypothetical protein